MFFSQIWLFRLNTKKAKEYFATLHYCIVELVATDYYQGEVYNVLKNKLHSLVLNTSITGY